MTLLVGPKLVSRVNILANSDPPGGGRNKQRSENEEEIRVFYCLELKNQEEIRRKGKKLEILAKIFTLAGIGPLSCVITYLAQSPSFSPYNYLHSFL